MKYLLLYLLMACSGMAIAQPYPFLGYTIYDNLVTATHPNGCPQEYVTGLPDDSTWVNMYNNSIMTGYFGGAWSDLPGDDLLLEACFHHHNYSVRLILEGGNFSASHIVGLNDWDDHPWITWKHIFPGCIEGTAASGRLLLPLDFGLFGISPEAVVLGIEITFLPTVGLADFAGAYIIVPPCDLFTLGPDTTICPGETVTLDATTPDATYLWQDGSTDAIFEDAGPGTYWVKVTIFDCTKTDYINVIEHPGPSDLGDDLLLCAGESQVLDITTPGATYQWQDNSTQPTYTVSQEGDYAVTVTIDNCEFTDFLQAEYVEIPEIELGNDTTLCEGFEVFLDATYPGASYEWQDQSTGSTFTVTEPGEYAVTVDVSGCIGEDVIEVAYTYLAPIDLGPDEMLCDGENFYVDAFRPGATYLWQDNSTLSGYTITEPGTYWVMIEEDNCFIGDTIEVDYAPAIILELGNDTTLCQGQSITLDATQPGATYTWQDQSTGSSFLVTSPGDYTVIVEIGDCSESDVIHVDFVNAINIQLGPDTNLCSGETIILNANAPGAAFEWQDQSTDSTFTVTQPGQYWVNVNLNDCVDTDTIQVDYLSLSTFDLGEDIALCDGETLLLDASQTGASYLWQDNSTAPSYFVTDEGTYQVTVSLGNCSISDTIIVDYNHQAQITLGNDTTLCQGETLLLVANEPGSVLEWQDQSSASSFLVNTAGTYWVTAYAGDCSTSDTIHVNYISLASIDLGADTTLCTGQQLTLDASIPSAAYLWQDNSTSQTLQVNQSGTYWVQVSSQGCEVSDTIHIAFQTLTAISLGSDTTLCDGESLILDATINNAWYAWQDQTTDSIFIVSQPGIYWVIARIGNCQVRDSIEVSYQNLPAVELGNDTTLCAGELLSLHAGYPGATYEWQDQSSLPDLLITQAGEYSVVVRTDLCQVKDTITIAYLELSSIDLGQDTTLCSSQTLTLEVNAPGTQYVWQDQSTSTSLVVSLPGMYWVEVSLANCATADTILVDIAPPISVNLGADTTLCPGTGLVLNAQTTGATYEWQDLSGQPTYLVTQAGTYYVTLDIVGCIAADTIAVDYIVLPLIDLGPDTSLCSGATLLLDATTPGGVYEWQNQSSGHTFIVSQPGMYWVQVSVDGCATADTIMIDLVPPISLELGADTTLCPGDALILDAQTLGATYTWQDFSGQSTYAVTQSGSYAVTVSVENCTANDTILVNYIDLPQDLLGADSTLCDGATLILDATTPGAQYEWQDQSTDPTIEVSHPGTYEVTLTLEQCTTTDAITIQYDTSVLVDLGMDRTICKGESIQLTPNVQQVVEYIWQDHSTAPIYEANEAGLYWVQVSDDCGTASDSVLVNVEDCDCHIYAGNVFSPNGDSVNDKFSPQASCAFVYYHLTVFDRFGGLVFETSIPGEGWDGYVNSKPAQVGVFVYLLTYTFEDGVMKRMYGDVTLLR